MTFAAFEYLTAIIPLLVFAGIVLGIWAVLSMISQRNSRSMERLSRLSRPQSLVDLEDPTKQANGERFQGLMQTPDALALRGVCAGRGPRLHAALRNLC